MREDEFLDYISFNDLKEAYEAKKREEFKVLEDEFESKKQFNTESKRQGIEKDRRHRDLLNTCIFPFTEKGPLSSSGYKFVRASPLYELNVQNMDFLLLKKSARNNIAIIGECKGSISNPGATITETISRIEVANEYSDHIRKEYLHLSHDDDFIFEYVIAVPTSYAGDILNKVIETESNLIVWSAPLTSDAELSIAFRPKSLTIPREKMMHRDRDLNKALQRVPSNRKVFDVFPQAHSFSKLTSLLRVARPGATGLIVAKEELQDLLSTKDLFYMEDEFIKKEIELILSMGEKMDFLEWSPEDNAYRIKARGTKRDTLETALEEKWIKNQLEIDLEKYKQKRLLAIQEDFIKERKKRKMITEY